MRKLKLLFGIILLLVFICFFGIIWKYTESTESNFFRFLGVTYYNFRYPNQIEVSTEGDIEKNHIEIQQITPQNDTLIVFQNSTETNKFIDAKDKNIFLVLYKNE